MWNPFKRKKKKPIDTSKVPEVSDAMIDTMMESQEGSPKVGRLQKMALRRLKKMPQEKRKEVIAQAMQKMTNDGEDKEKMKKEIEEMRQKGQLNRKQYRAARKRFGIK